MADDPLIPEVLDFPDTSKTLALTTKPKGAKPPPQPIASACKICGRATNRTQLNLCAEHAGIELEAQADKARVRAFLDRHAHRAAELVVEGAERAAQKGDTRPAEWLLLHTRTIEPIKTATDAGGGITINLGVILPHCGEAPE